MTKREPYGWCDECKITLDDDGECDCVPDCPGCDGSGWSWVSPDGAPGTWVICGECNEDCHITFETGRSIREKIREGQPTP